MWGFLKSLLLVVFVSWTGDWVLKVDSEMIFGEIFASALADQVQNVADLEARLGQEWLAHANLTSGGHICLESAQNLSVILTCLYRFPQICLDLPYIFQLYNLSSSQNLTQHEVLNLSPGLIYFLLSCRDSRSLGNAAAGQNTSALALMAPSYEASWGYSFLFVTLINMCSLTGALVLPCMKLKSYKLLLMFMVALAVGTLAGSGLLFLIPEAFHLVHDQHSDYIWKSTAIMGGIYLFYLTEKIMRMINSRREDTNIKKQRDRLATQGAITSSFRHIPIDNSIPAKDPTHLAENMRICSSEMRTQSSFHSDMSEVTAESSLRTEDLGVDEQNMLDPDLNSADFEKHPCNGNGHHNKHDHHHHHHHHHHHQSSEVAPVAYMIIFGDALHNFIDGLSIGSAFTQSIMTGVSVSVAVMCEELPHELGDFAILLNSGIKFRKALMYNFLSACTCYIGTAVGLVLAENTSSHEWIFAVAGGMFLYISLVDMMPEMNTAAESDAGKQFGETPTFILQNFGLLSGYSIMLIFALYGGNISFD